MFEAGRYRTLDIPVLLQIGSESPQDLIWDALAAVLPNASVAHAGRSGHEGMTTAPDMYVEAVTTFLLGPPHLLERSSSVGSDPILQPRVGPGL